MGPMSNPWHLSKRDRHTQGEHHVEREKGTGVGLKPRATKRYLQRGSKEQILPWGLQKGVSPIDALIAYFQPLELGE